VKRPSFTPDRRHDPELMDAPGLPEAEVADAYRVLRQVNRQFFGGRRPMARELDRFLRDEATPGPITILDVGSGSGDLARFASDHLATHGRPALPIALDRDPTALSLAVDDSLIACRADALRLPFADASIDLVLAVKFAHHLSGSALTALFAEMARVARRRVIVLDIRRHWLAYVGFVAWSRIFTRNRLVRHDGPLSVLRGFTSGELLDASRGLLAFDWTVRRYAGFQLALVGRHRDR
jgi:SAM-dependent methyltransferase